MRAINLLGSALFGLAITNMIWLMYIYIDEDPDSVWFKISFEGDTATTSMYSNASSSLFDNDDGMFYNNITTTEPPKPDFEIILPLPSNEALGNTLQVTKGMVSQAIRRERTGHVVSSTIIAKSP